MSIQVRFQPIVDVTTRTVLGYESTLIGKNGENAPTLFDIAATKEAIVSLDSMAIELSLKRGLPLLRNGQVLFINVHPETIDHGFVFRETEGLNNVVFEITEQSTLLDRHKNNFEFLKCAGAKFAVDDYGKRNSNIDRLAIDWFNPSYLKLDREFVSKIEHPRVSSIIKHTSALCSETGIDLIVEGVETQEQVSELRALGVRYMQGYYLGMPKEFPDVFLPHCTKFNMA